MKSKCAEPDPRPYRGRFAPTPSGPLHLGSLVAAVGSYLDARAHQGSWLVRIEDIDPPREVPGASAMILRQLEVHGLYWDEPVRYQSNQTSLYAHHLQRLTEIGAVYACDCTRQQIKARAPFYTGFCRDRQLPYPGNALRFVNDSPVLSYQDLDQGKVTAPPAWAGEDFLLKRRDGLWAYQLAVVSDDRDQGITDIVRGRDLMLPSLWQLSLWQGLNKVVEHRSVPRLRHLPLLTDEQGRKLSKQNHAPPLNINHAAKNLHTALQVLGLEVPEDLQHSDVETLLEWSCLVWKENLCAPHRLSQQ